MGNRTAARKVKAKELSPSLRRRFHLVPDEEVTITVIKQDAKKARQLKDPWVEIRGTLSPEEAEQMLDAIHESRRSKSEAPEVDAP
jgi:uncharacterized membrane protein YcgQ (UPF0703/DUF1980 family)